MSAQSKMSEKTQFGHDKVQRYGWTVADEPGSMRMIHKQDLQIDDAYQRATNEAKVTSITGEWSWIACGAIIVADRGDGAYFVVDGQHRVLAARRRSDIQALPCVVFRSKEVRDEAAGFLRSNTHRKPLTSIEKFRALVVVGDPAAMAVKDAIDSSGYTISTSDHAGTVSCMTSLLNAYRRDPKSFRVAWDLSVLLSSGEAIPAELFSGLFCTERKMLTGTSLADARWSDRLEKIGATAIGQSIRATTAYRGCGGSASWSEGVVNAINKGLRSTLVLRSDSPQEPAE